MSFAKEVSGSSVFVNECKKRRESIYYYTIVEFLADEETPANLWLMYEKVLVFSCLLMCAKQLFFVVYYTTSVVKTPLRWSWALHAKCSSFLTTLCLDLVSEATKICRKKVFCNATTAFAFYVISHGWKFNGKGFCSGSQSLANQVLSLIFYYWRICHWLLSGAKGVMSTLFAYLKLRSARIHIVGKSPKMSHSNFYNFGTLQQFLSY